MNDPEFIELRNRFLLGVFIALLFIIPFFYFLKNKLIIDESIINEIKNGENLTILVVENNCKECKKYEEHLKNNNVSYKKINKKEDKNYELILNKLNISYNDITSPTIIYIEKQNVVATLPNMRSDKEINAFIINYNLEGNIK